MNTYCRVMVLMVSLLHCWVLNFVVCPLMGVGLYGALFGSQSDAQQHKAASGHDSSGRILLA